MIASSSSSFGLAPRLAADTRVLGDLPLCRVLLMNDARYPWLVLVPRRPGLIEILDLDRAARLVLMDELADAAQALKAATAAEKLNLGAIGNLVPQLHLHVVARHAADEAWPAPVWGRGEPHPYEDQEAEALGARIAAHLTQPLLPVPREEPR